VDSATQIIAEVGATAATFPSDKQLSSWVGACPGDDESAGVNYNHRSPKGNRHMRRVLNQAANAAVKVKGSIFEIVYRRSVPRLGHNQAIGAIAHRQCRLIWLPRSPLRGTRSRGHHTIEASTNCQNDPATPKTRLPGRTTEFPVEQSSWKVIFDPARHTAKRGRPWWPSPFLQHVCENLPEEVRKSAGDRTASAGGCCPGSSQRQTSTEWLDQRPGPFVRLRRLDPRTPGG